MPKPRSKRSRLDNALLDLYDPAETRSAAQIISKVDLSSSDFARLRNAKAHILGLLDDPYYFAAYQELRREKHPKLAGLSGAIFKNQIDLALKYQGEAAPKHNGKGRPQKENTEYLKTLLTKMESRPGSLKDNCRIFATNWVNDPDTPCGLREMGVDYVVTWLYERLRGIRRRSKERAKLP